MLNFKPNVEVLEDLNEYVSGHIEAKKALITMIDRSRRRNRQKHPDDGSWGMEDSYLLYPSKILLIGPSGTGKTHLIESLHKVVSFPLIRVDATKMTPSGAGSGGIKELELQKMIVEEATRYWQSGYSITIESAIDQTVVFVDEIDKLGKPWESSGNWSNHVQSNFLTLFDNKTEFAGLSFVFAGAFSEITSKGESKSLIGFNNQDKVENKPIADDDIIKYGLIPELVGRITSIVELDKFTKEDYNNILMNRLLPKKAMDLATIGIFGNVLDKQRATEICEYAFKSGQGIRALQRELEKEFLELEFGYETNDNLLSLGWEYSE